MKWISALELQQWADKIGARTIFPGLLRDLITGSVADISEVRFPSGDKGQVRGFDGWLDAAGAPPYVPAGRSIWEFGVNANPASKFKSDYDKRVKEISATDRKSTTFVFVSPRTWDNPTTKLPEFVKAFRDKKEFKNVQYIDGVQLEDWMQRCGAVGARYAREVLGRVPQNGARSTDEFWEEFSRRFLPPVTEEVVLAARSEQAGEIITHLLGKPSSMVLVADGPDEVNAVAIAAIRKAPDDSRRFLEARTLVVDTEEAGRGLAAADRYGYLVSPSANKISGFLARYGPTISALGFNPPGQRYPRLVRPSTREMTDALQSMDISEEDASILAIKSGRSLTILERQAPAASYTAPQWVSDGLSLIPALLAGGWDSRHEGDQAILTELAGASDYLAVEARLRGFLSQQDSPLDREGGIWKLRAPVDALVNLANLLGSEHLTLIGRIAVRLFESPPPSIAEERFGMSKAPYSSQLREGVAGTLLMLAVLHRDLDLDLGQDAEGFVNSLVDTLPGLNEDYRVIAALDRQLPMFMEAAPDPLLSALEHLLEGEAEKLLPIFEESSDFSASRSQLAPLLWALEAMAWDPRYFPRISRVLARMAAVDPGGRAGNTPIASLRDIFTAWDPGTNAPLDVRLAVLDEIVAESPVVGWKLLVSLLPKMQDTKSPTQRPRFREAGASQRETLTYGLVAETYDAVTDRTLALLDNDAAKWLAVLASYPRLSPDRRAQFLAMLQSYAASTSGEVRIALRRDIQRLAVRHRRFPEATWTLPADELNRLDAIAQSIESVDPIEKARVLFDEWFPETGDDFAERERQITELREMAIARLADDVGLDAILEVAKKARIPSLVASAAGKGIDNDEMLGTLIDKAIGIPELEEFAISLSGVLRWTRGPDFEGLFKGLADRHRWTAAQTATLILGWPECARTWELVTSLGPDAAIAFWQQRSPRQMEGSAEEVATLALHYLGAGRAGAALEAVHGREDDLDQSLIATLLGMRVAEINAGGVKGDMDSYYIEELFKKLRLRDDIPRIDIARWEYAFFPVLEYLDRELVLYDLMASDPEFFVSILKDVFVEDDVDPDQQETTEEQRNRGSASHRILIAFDRAPGQAPDGIADAAALDAWVDGAIEAASREKRLNVIYSYIGRALAHSAEKDALWPQEPVADVIERLKSSDLERGIQIERYNMRGVYTKSMFEGGRQERDLAERYRSWAAKMPGSKLRTRGLLNAIAASWDVDAVRADEEAARDKLRFE